MVEEKPLTDSQKVLLMKFREEIQCTEQRIIERIEHKDRRFLRACKELASNAVGIFDRLLK